LEIGLTAPWIFALVGASVTFMGMFILILVLGHTVRKQSREHLCDRGSREDFVIAVLRELRNEDYERFSAMMDRIVGVSEKMTRFSSSFTNILKMLVFEDRATKQILTEVLARVKQLQGENQ
jgi:hypothetical protein